MFPFSSVAIHPKHFKLACNLDMHNILDELKFQPDWTTDCGVSCHLASKIDPIDLYRLSGERSLPFGLFV